jgi:hypothetical protein
MNLLRFFKKVLAVFVISLCIALWVSLSGELCAENHLNGWQAKEFSTMTFNVFYDFSIDQTFEDNKRRQKWTAYHISQKHPKLIAIQEDFFWHIWENVTGYHYCFAPSGNEPVKYGNGLTAFSDFQLLGNTLNSWFSHTGWDSSAKKGFTFTKN